MVRWPRPGGYRRERCEKPPERGGDLGFELGPTFGGKILLPIRRQHRHSPALSGQEIGRDGVGAQCHLPTQG